MPVQTTKKNLINDIDYVSKCYIGNIFISELFGNVVQNVVHASTQNLTFILSNWEQVTNVEFSVRDVSAAVEASFTVDFLDRHLFIALVLNDNPHIAELADVFSNSLNSKDIHVKICDSDAHAVEWFKQEYNRLAEDAE